MDQVTKSDYFVGSKTLFSRSISPFLIVCSIMITQRYIWCSGRLGPMVRKILGFKDLAGTCYHGMYVQWVEDVVGWGCVVKACDRSLGRWWWDCITAGGVGEVGSVGMLMSREVGGGMSMVLGGSGVEAFWVGLSDKVEVLT